jgi:3-oxo-5alpha-steroid 4-dehydrogenase
MPDRFATDRLRDARRIPEWSETADVIVVGLGSAGACAALEAHRVGAHVVVLEKQDEGGGTSARAAGQLYLGGGTALQQACGFEDSAEDMATYMKMACGPGAPDDKIDLFVSQSVEHYDWLVSQGVPFKPSFVPTTEATNPPNDDGLTYTGSEPAHPWCEHARPAPRGHNVQNVGDSGVVLMRTLLGVVEREGIDVRTNASVERLAIDEGGRVVGIGLRETDGDRERWIEARRGVVLCTGGFGFNREMLGRYAPTLLDCSPVGTEAEDGLGIRLGMAAGGDAIRMDAGCVMIPFSKPRSLVRGIIVNGRGERFVNEDVYQAVHGDIALHRQDGVSYLIVDADTWSEPQLPFPTIAEADSPEALEQALDLPVGSLVATLARWNAGAARGEDPLLHKGADWITPLTKPPFRAIDLRRETFPYPFFTLGGLRTDTEGRVLTPEGEVIEGLFAAGRTTSGMPAQGYNSGMSLSDCTFFGRRAGLCAAGAL